MTAENLLVLIICFVPLIVATLAWIKLVNMRTQELVVVLEKHIKSVGGSEITIERLPETRGDLTTRFKVTFIGENGHEQHHIAWRVPLEMPKNTFNWDPSLDSIQRPRAASSSKSKEQIVSEMAAEIEALKRQLDERSEDSAEINNT